MRAPFPAVGAARPLLPPAGCPLRAAQSPTLRPWGSGTSMETPGITHPQSWASVPKFDKVPWPGEASLRNKPLVLSLPKRSPHSYAIFPTSSKDMNLSILFHVPDVFSKVRKNQNNSMLLPNKPLCSTCQEISMIQSRPLRIPDGLKLSFKNFVSHRTMSLPQPQTQTFPKPSHDDIPTESIHYKLPILGPRTAVFHGLLSDAYKSLQEMEQTSLLRKEPTGKTVRTRCLGSERPHHASL